MNRGDVAVVYIIQGKQTTPCLHTVRCTVLTWRRVPKDPKNVYVPEPDAAPPNALYALVSPSSIETRATPLDPRTQRACASRFQKMRHMW